MPKLYKYVPILKTKAGELGAIKELDEQAKQYLMPLFEVSPMDWDYEKNEFKKSIDEHIASLAKRLIDSWSSHNIAFIDGIHLPEGMTLRNGGSPMRILLNNCSSNNLNIVPVTGLFRNSSYQIFISDWLNEHNCDCAIRMTTNEFNNPNIDYLLEKFLDDNKLTSNRTHVIIDYQYVEQNQVAATMEVINNITHRISKFGEWSTFTIVGSSFPYDLSKVTPNSKHLIARSEWKLWNLTFKNENKLIPQYGDYGISHPEINQMDPRFLNTSAAIRYTTTEDWLIIKGRGLKTEDSGGHQQYYTLSELLVNFEEYMGSKFSWGDTMIDKKSRREGTTGNTTTWRKIGTNHHIMMAIHQLSKLAYF